MARRPPSRRGGGTQGARRGPKAHVGGGEAHGGSGGSRRARRSNRTRLTEEWGVSRATAKALIRRYIAEGAIEQTRPAVPRNRVAALYRVADSGGQG
jgi:hypothetical protein